EASLPAGSSSQSLTVWPVIDATLEVTSVEPTSTRPLKSSAPAPASHFARANPFGKAVSTTSGPGSSDVESVAQVATDWKSEGPRASQVACECTATTSPPSPTQSCSACRLAGGFVCWFASHSQPRKTSSYAS